MKTRLLLPTVYAALCGGAWLWMLGHAKETPFAGLFAVLLTLPWSVLAVFVLAWRFPDLFDSSLVPATIVIATAACVNVVLLFAAGAKWDGRASGPS